MIIALSAIPVQSANELSIIKKLDTEILKRKEYLLKKDSTIKELKAQLNQSQNTTVAFEFSDAVFEAYKSYQYDSAYIYANKTLLYARCMNNADLILKAQSNLLFCFFSGGDFKEASDVIQLASTVGTSRLVRGNFYALCARYYTEMLNYSRVSDYYEVYQNKIHAYRDSVMSLLPDTSYVYRLVETLYDMTSTADRKIALCKKLLNDSPNIHQQAILCSNMANLFIQQKDTLQAVKYWAEASCCDLRASVMETTSKTELARCLYAKGFLEEANRYAQLALEEANFYNATHRIVSINTILPIIEKTFLNKIEEQRDNLRFYLWIVSLLTIGAVLAILLIHRQKIRLRQVGEKLEEQSHKLSELNEIKDAYIWQAICAKSAYLDKTETILKKIENRVKFKQYAELKYVSNEFGLKDERKNLFADFDRTFLMLFPNFISEYNLLFSEKDRITVENGLVPEMRIFALIRLGITDNEEIAHFLNLSVNTIYAYKAKVKAKTLVPKEKFEDFIGRISKNKS